MERLTKRFSDPIMLCPLIKTLNDDNEYCQSQRCDCDNCELGKQLVKLSEYETLEEQGLLLRLPCKIGDTLYAVAEHANGKREIVETVFYGIEHILRYKDNIGKGLYLTRAEAEKALAEMG